MTVFAYPAKTQVLEYAAKPLSQAALAKAVHRAQDNRR